MRLSLMLLAGALLVAGGCFSEPPATTTTGEGDSTEGGETLQSTTSGDDDSDEGDTGDETSDDEGRTTGDDSDDTTGSGSTGVEVDPLLNLYESCEGQWEAYDGAGLVLAPCDQLPATANTQGGSWQYPMHLSDAFGDQFQALVVQPYPVEDGVTQASFGLDPIDLDADPFLFFEYEFINVDGGALGEMTFQVLLEPPEGDSITLLTATYPGNASGSISPNLAQMIGGPGFELVFVLIADSFEPGQGVALYNAAIYPDF